MPAAEVTSTLAECTWLYIILHVNSYLIEHKILIKYGRVLIYDYQYNVWL